MTDKPALPPEMHRYDRKEWIRLQEHWNRKAQRRELVPPKARAALESAKQRSGEALAHAGRQIAEHTPEGVKNGIEYVFDAALVPTVKAAVHLVELAEEWAMEAMDPEAVLAHHRGNGHQADHLDDLKMFDLDVLDGATNRLALRWRSLGAAEGGAMGALALVPVAGLPMSVTADFVVMQVLSTAVASRVMYSYGFDAKHPEERQTIERIVRRTYRSHLPKAAAVRDASRAFNASRHRVRWSAKLREDHKLMAAIERLMKQISNDSVSVKDVSKKLPVIAIITSAGSNAYVLGDVAKQGTLYCKTRFIAEKYGLPLPANLLIPDEETDDSEESAD